MVFPRFALFLPSITAAFSSRESDAKRQVYIQYVFWILRRGSCFLVTDWKLSLMPHTPQALNDAVPPNLKHLTDPGALI